jgi:pimeloyl-ACP methyl ester carboxylesterase
MGLTYVLIPGAGGQAGYWYRVDRELRRRGRDAVCVELPAGDDAAGLAEYADTVEAAVGDRDGLAVVAQSMGAYTGTLVCGRRPVSLLVLLNPMIPAPGETFNDWWTNTGQSAARREMDLREGRDPDAEFDPATVFFHDVPPDVVETAFPGGEPEQSDTPLDQPWPLPAWPDVPTRVVAGRDDRLFPAGFQQRVAEERLGITPDVLPGGHLLALSHPVELVDLLERYGAEIG